MYFDPVAGHEQGGHRPAVVLSPFAYNNIVGLLLCVPCATQIKGNPFEVTLSGSKEGGRCPISLHALTGGLEKWPGKPRLAVQNWQKYAQKRKL